MMVVLAKAESATFDDLLLKLLAEYADTLVEAKRRKRVSISRLSHMD